MTRFGSLRRPGALISVTAAGLLGVGLAAVPASAHTPHLTVDCSTATVDLSAYNGSVTNHVKVTVQGDDSLTVDQGFKDSFHTKIKLPDHSSPVAVHLVVTAADSSRYNVDETETAKVCPGQSPPPSSASAQPSAPASSAPASSAPAAPSKAPSSPAAAAPVSSPSPAGENLAETGSSSSTPIIAGAAAVVVIAGAGILWASRRRRAAQS